MPQKKSGHSHRSKPTLLDYAIIGAFVYTLLVPTLMLADLLPVARCEAWEDEPYVSHCDAPVYTALGNTMIAFGAASFLMVPILVVIRAQRDPTHMKVTKKK